jgi:sugar lactone lactonase YvrE
MPIGAQSIHAGREGESGYADGNGGNARFAGVCALAIDNNGNIYAADEENHRIRKITPDGNVTTLTGNGEAGFVDGARDKASFQEPKGIAVDDSGAWVYVADTYNNRIRKISAGSGMTGTLAGSGDDARLDGAGKQAAFDGPQSLAVDSQGNVYVSDTLNRCIRKIGSGGLVTTIAGTDYVGSSDGPAATASFAYPLGLTVDKQGNLYVADVDNDRIRKVTPDGIVLTLVGLRGLSENNIDGRAEDATLVRPEALCFDQQGNLYFSDDGIRIRKITLATQMTTRLSNTVTTLGEGDTHVPNNARGVLATNDGWLYVADTETSRVRKGLVVGFDRSEDEFAGGNKNEPPLMTPSGMTMGAQGEIYVADAAAHSIRVIQPSGQVKNLAGTDEAGYTDGVAVNAEFREPRYVAFDARDGSIYVSDTGNNRIRKISIHGNVTTLAGGSSDSKVALRDGRGTSASFHRPGGISLDLLGNLWVADTNNNAIRRIALGTGEVTTVAGGNLEGKLADGQGRGASFNHPMDLTVDGNGDVFVCDRDNHAVRRVSSTGMVTTIAGSPSDSGTQDGEPSTATFTLPQSITLDPAGNLYVTHGASHRVRKIANVTTSGCATLSLLARKMRHRSKRALEVDSESDSDSDDEGRGQGESKRPLSSFAPGDVITIAGDGTVGEKDALGIRSSFNHPRGMAMDRWGYLFVADQGITPYILLYSSHKYPNISLLLCLPCICVKQKTIVFVRSVQQMM